jgi:hypothetical protein
LTIDYNRRNTIPSRKLLYPLLPRSAPRHSHSIVSALDKLLFLLKKIFFVRKTIVVDTIKKTTLLISFKKILHRALPVYRLLLAFGRALAPHIRLTCENIVKADREADAPTQTRHCSCPFARPALRRRRRLARLS